MEAGRKFFLTLFMFLVGGLVYSSVSQPKPIDIHKRSICKTCDLLAWFLVGTLGMTLTTVPSNCSMLISSKMTVP